MPSKFLIPLLMLMVSPAWSNELTCLKGEIKKLLDDKEIFEKSSYCSNKEGTILVEESCYKKNCLKSLSPVNFDLAEAAEVGSPGFVLCRKIGGKPEIIEFKWKGEWLSLDRCLLEKPMSTFVDTGHLYKLNRDKLKK